MKKVLFYFFLFVLFILSSVYLSSCNTQKGYNYSNHRKKSEKMHRQTQRVNKHNYNQLDHKCSPKKHR